MTLSNEMSYFTMAHLLFTGNFNPLNEFASELVQLKQNIVASVA
ncbi:hypothetical protein [Desulfosporosinus sp. FKB]|nr:hypothetical protein [Desulfosporosinus sp. FKB]